MTSKIFHPGTVIDSNWLNDVNEGIYNTLPGKISAVSPVLVTPNIGNATAVTVNGITFTQSTGTLTIPNGTTATVSGVNTGDQNLTNYAQFNGTNTWTGSNVFPSATIAVLNSTTTSTNVMYNAAFPATGSTGAITLNTATSSTYTISPTGNIVITFSGVPPTNRDQTVYLRIVNGGAFTVTFASGTKFPGGTMPTLTASGKDLLSAWYDPFDGMWVVGMVWKDMR